MRNFTDTIWPSPIMTSNPCGDTITYYGFSTSGYVTGNNGYGFTEIGTRVNHTGNGSVTNVYAIVDRLGSVGTGTCSAKIYSSSANKPVTCLGTSAPITLSTFAINSANDAVFTFTPAVSVSGNFFATVVLPTDAGDTIVVFSTSETCTPSPDSLSMFFYSGTCYYYNSMVGYNGDVWVSAIVNEIVGINNNNAIENISVYNSDNKIVVKNNSNTTIKQVMVYNLLGQEIVNHPVNNNGTITLDANLPAASYIVRVITDSKVGTYKLYVNR